MLNIRKTKKIQSRRIKVTKFDRKANIMSDLYEKFNSKRKKYKIDLKKADTYEEKQEILAEQAKIPRRASPSRSKTICSLTGRRRGILSQFGVSRLEFRRLGRQGRLPGMVKASW